MATEIRVQEGIKLTHKEYLENWGEQVFPEEGKAFTWTEPSHHVIAWVSNKPVGHIGFGQYSIKSQGGLLPVVGVGGVVVRPEFQGMKIPQDMFAVLHRSNILNASKLPFTLFCPKRLVAYYKKHGYFLHEEQVPFIQNNKLTTSAFCFMSRGDLMGFKGLALTTEPW